MFNRKFKWLQSDVESIQRRIEMMFTRFEFIENDICALKIKQYDELSKKETKEKKEYKYCVMQKGQEKIITADGFKIPDNQNVIFERNGIVVAWFDRNKVDSIELL